MGRLYGEGLEEAAGLLLGELLFFVGFFVVLFVCFFVIVEVIEIIGVNGGAGFCEIQAFGRGFDGADDVGCEGSGLEAASILGGELEPVEQGGGAPGIKLSGCERVDDDGEGDLDGFAILEGGEFDVLAGDEVAAGGGGGTEGVVSLMEVMVEVAPEASNEGGRLASGSVGLDVAAEC